MTEGVSGIAEVGDLELELGGTLVDVRVGYRTWGELAPDGRNVVVLPSYFSGTTASYTPWMGDGSAYGDGASDGASDGTPVFDTAEWFVVAYDQLGAGDSTKPSDPGRGGFGNWPSCVAADSVRAARRMLDQIGVHHVRMVCGWSMGGMQAFAWAGLFPEFVDSAVAICATPEASEVNQVFLDGVRSVLDCDGAVSAGALDEEQTLARLRAFGRVYAGWAYSDGFFLDGVYREFGYTSAADVLDGWAEDHVEMDAHDLLAQLECWQRTETPARGYAPDIIFGAVVDGASSDSVVPGSATSHGASGAALCTEPVVYAMPGSTDRYFLTCTVEAARDRFPGMQVKPIESDLGHIAGRPGIRETETAQIRVGVEKVFSQLEFIGGQRNGPPSGEED